LHNHGIHRIGHKAGRPVMPAVRGTPAARRERGELLRQRLFFRPPESGLTNHRWSA